MGCHVDVGCRMKTRVADVREFKFQQLDEPEDVGSEDDEHSSDIIIKGLLLESPLRNPRYWRTHPQRKSQICIGRERTALLWVLDVCATDFAQVTVQIVMSGSQLNALSCTAHGVCTAPCFDFYLRGSIDKLNSPYSPSVCEETSLFVTQKPQGSR